MSSLKMSWNDRFAVIDHFKPNDTQVCAAFGLSQDELDIARSLRAAGTFSPSKNVDMSRFENVFTAVAAGVQSASPSSTMTVHSSASSRPVAAPTTKQSNATTHSKPESATRKAKEPQKRGRKGDKIANALAAVPTEKMSAEEFARQHNVSIAVLRQSKRFLEQMTAEQRAAIGNVCVRQDKDTKVLQIWREPAAS